MTGVEGASLDIRIDGAEALGRLSRHLLDVAGKEMSKELRRAVKDVTEPIARDMRSKAAEASRPVARSIVVERRLTGRHPSVIIKAKRSRMPKGHEDLPAALENGGREGTFKHPVFGDRTTWVRQKAHPFMAPVIRGHEQAIRDAFVDAVNRVAHRAGIEV